MLVFALAAAGGVVLMRLLRTELSAQRQETRDELAARSSEIGRRLEGLDGRLLSTQQSAGQTATQIVDKIGELGRTSAQMLQRANDLARLEQALRPPKARGGVGELLLANVLRDSLPADAYELQHTFRSGERVDAVVRADKLVPIDAKFPLENFERVVNAADEAEQELYEKAFARDVKIHVDAIAAKYVRPADGTFDFALMYLPSESIYYELVCGKTGGLYSYALGKRVFPVSPSTFHAYLAIIVLGLRGLQIERHAQDVMAYCAQLAKDFDRFRDDFNVVGKPIGNAASKYSEADRRLSGLGRGAAALRALPRRPAGAFLEEERLDPPVRGGLERLVPAGSGAAAAARLLAPALEGFPLAPCTRLLEHGGHDLEDLRGRRVRLRLGPADDRAFDLLGEEPREFRPRLFRGDDDDVGAGSPLERVELLGD